MLFFCCCFGLLDTYIYPQFRAVHVSTPFSVSFRRAPILLWMDNCNGVSDCLVIDLVFVLLV